VLRALGHPVTFVGLLVGFLVAALACTAAQRVCARAFGVRLAPREPGAHGWLDPYGCVAAILGGPGWGPVEAPVRGARWKQCAALLSGPIVAGLLGAAALVGYAGQAGGREALTGRPNLGDVISGIEGSAKLVLPLCAGLEAVTVALLALVPLPPLTGWKILTIFMRPTIGWQRTRMNLEERNIGVLILLILTVIPLGGELPILVKLLDYIIGLILQAVAGG
jgi:hypothetical protein